jgi:hypothetical protein
VVSGSLAGREARMSPGLEGGAAGRPLPAECLETLSGPEPEDGSQTGIIQWVRAQEDATARRTRALARRHAE